MTNEAYFKILDEIFQKYSELRKKGVSLAKRIYGQTLTKDDLFFCASLDRCIHLIDGIIPPLKDRNLTCAGALLRLQMDNCMRTYAAFIAKDKEKVINCLIYGTPIKNELDIRGNKMSDNNLKIEVTKLDSKFEQVYNQASGYVHLSEKAFYQTVTDIGEDGKLILQVGHDSPEKQNYPLLECAKAFNHFVLLHYKMLNAVAESKERFDKELGRNEEQIL